MLDKLVETIDSLKQRIRDHRDDIQDNEWRTRHALINPMLCALGWDVSNPKHVVIEPKVVSENSQRWADYGLLNDRGQTLLFLEAKKLNDRNEHVWQTVSYVVQENSRGESSIRYCACTNGDIWRIYDVRAPQPQIMEVSITRDSSAKCALKLSSLWRVSLEDGSLVEPIQPIAEAERPALSQQNPGQLQISEALTPRQEPPRPIEHPGDWTPLTAEFATLGSPAPTVIRFPNGQEITTRYWIHILIETARWLYRAGMLTSENCRMFMTDSTGASSYLLSPDGRHTTRAFRSPQEIAEGIYLECNLSSRDIIHQSQRLLRRFDQDPSTTLLQFAQQ